MQHVYLQGQLKSGERWVTANWRRMLAAHTQDVPDLAEYHPGTLNVVLSERWTPPDDEVFRRRSHLRGLADRENYCTGADFLANGNYFHPYIRVVAVKGVPIDGLLYFPGSAKQEWYGNDAYWDQPQPRNRIEVASKAHIRSALGIGAPDEIDVVVALVADKPAKGN